MLTSEVRLLTLPPHINTPCLTSWGSLFIVTSITYTNHEYTHLCVYCPSPRQVANYTGAAPYYHVSGASTGPDILKVQYLLNKLMHEFIHV